MTYDQKFEQITLSSLSAEHYEHCSFINCHWQEGDLGKFSFEDCTFKHCDLSLCKTEGTGFKSVIFDNCKLMGIHFEDCNDFRLQLKFTSCLLHFSTFIDKTINNLIFIDCELQNVDFSAAKLPGVLFQNSNLEFAKFEGTNLERGDFTTANNFLIDPRSNQLKMAKFDRSNVTGLLQSFQIIIT